MSADLGSDTYRRLIETAPDAIVGVGVDGTILFANTQTATLFGYASEELIGESIDVLVPDGVRAVHRGHRARYVADPQWRPMGAGMELTGRRKDGTEFPAEVSLSAIDTAHGLIVSAAVRDVTEQRRVQHMFRDLLESAPDAVVGVDEAGAIVLANAQAERLFGYTRDELLGGPLDVLLPERARAAHPDHRRGYFEDPKPRPMGAGMELAGRRRDGSEFPAEISLSALETPDGVVVSAAIRDVTARIELLEDRERLRAQAEREHLESQLHQSQRLESLGHLAGGVAHDFNNLLAVIANYASFIHEEASVRASGEPDDPWEAVRRDAEQVEEASVRASRLTRQLLAFARREVVRPQVIDLNDIVGGVEQILTRTLGEHVELVVRLHPLLPVLADPGQLEQVIVNLVVNARDAMPGGGTLCIETQTVSVDDDYATRHLGLATGRYTRLRVSDSGSGMEPETLARAFEPFFTTKPEGEGTGLGLATVYGIITQAGGHVHLYSEPGVGTTVTILLPSVFEVPDAPDAVPEPTMQTGGGTVLVVEDEDAVREVARRILSNRGYRVLTAASGAQALELLADADTSVDLLISDVIMPHMLGKQLVERARALRPELEVLYMSGYAQPVLTAQGTLEPGVHLIEKPFSAATLVREVRLALGR